MLFENRARTSRRTIQKTLSGRYGPVMEPVLLVGWQDISIYNVPVSTRRNFYVKLMDNVVRHEFSLILACPSPPILNYATRHCRGRDARFKAAFERLLEKEPVDMFLASFAHAARYRIHYFRQGDPRMTQWQGYGVLSQLPHATTHIISSSYVM